MNLRDNLEYRLMGKIDIETWEQYYKVTIRESGNMILLDTERDLILYLQALVNAWNL